MPPRTGRFYDSSAFGNDDEDPIGQRPLRDTLYAVRIDPDANHVFYDLRDLHRWLHTNGGFNPLTRARVSMDAIRPVLTEERTPRQYADTLAMMHALGWRVKLDEVKQDVSDYAQRQPQQDRGRILTFINRSLSDSGLYWSALGELMVLPHEVAPELKDIGTRWFLEEETRTLELNAATMASLRIALMLRFVMQKTNQRPQLAWLEAEVARHFDLPRINVPSYLVLGEEPIGDAKLSTLADLFVAVRMQLCAHLTNQTFERSKLVGDFGEFIRVFSPGALPVYYFLGDENAASLRMQRLLPYLEARLPSLDSRPSYPKEGFILFPSAFDLVLFAGLMRLLDDHEQNGYLDPSDEHNGRRWTLRTLYPDVVTALCSLDMPLALVDPDQSEDIFRYSILSMIEKHEDWIHKDTAEDDVYYFSKHPWPNYNEEGKSDNWPYAGPPFYDDDSLYEELTSDREGGRLFDSPAFWGLVVNCEPRLPIYE